jgi:hypothetical protein
MQRGSYFVLVAVAAAAMLSGCGKADPQAAFLVPLQPPAPPVASADGEQLMAVAECVDAQLALPFVIRRDADASGSQAVVLSEGAGTTAKSGRISCSLQVPAAGEYAVWARVKWRDSCSNSMTIQLPGQPQRVVGEDSVYGTWHWVRAGKAQLAAGANSIIISEREDGIGVDQLLASLDPDLVPIGPLQVGSQAVAERQMVGIRRFADDFHRSPGHGMNAWILDGGDWDIAFDFDPNRIPNQYALVGKGPAPAEDGEGADAGERPKAVAAVNAPAWRGCRVSCSFRPIKPGRYGCFFRGETDERVVIVVSEESATVEIGGVSTDLGDRLRLGQWHRLQVERWAWVTRVLIDGAPVAVDFNGAAGPIIPGLLVEEGEAVFDDAAVDEILWAGDDGGDNTIDWSIGAEAQWFRSTNPDRPMALVGRGGALRADWPGQQIAELAFERGMADNNCLQGGWVMSQGSGRQGLFSLSAPGSTLSLSSGGTAQSEVVRAAVRFSDQRDDGFNVGPYHFTQAKIADPSDYLDFTKEEYDKMRKDPEYDKLKRSAKFRPLVGSSGGDSTSVWMRERGSWYVQGGVLLSSSAYASKVRHYMDISVDFDMHCRVQLLTPESVARIHLFGPDVMREGEEYKPVGTAVVLATTADDPSGKSSSSRYKSLSRDGARVLDSEWHDLTLQARGAVLQILIDGEAVGDQSIVRGYGGGISLYASGRAQFDDIEFVIPRRTNRSRFYAFDRQETDFWREGGDWLEHGGISCVLASSWLSLKAQESKGMLWSKTPCAADVQVAFYVEENTDWYGWQAYPSHVHYPYDNITAVLGAEADADTGYRMIVNGDNRSATILYRNGKEVARRLQNFDFPIRYVGGHAPYTNRSNRVTLRKEGGLITGYVNDVKVIEYEDAEPIDVSTVGVGGHNTSINFANIEIQNVERREASEPLSRTDP